MVEGGRIDHACHENDLVNTIGDTLAFDSAIGVALKFAQCNGRTLLIVTADHETGGLAVVDSEIFDSNVGSINVKWTGTDHTGNEVPIFGYGPKASRVSTFDDNTDIGKFLFEVLSYSAEETIKLANYFILTDYFSATAVSIAIVVSWHVGFICKRQRDK